MEEKKALSLNQRIRNDIEDFIRSGEWPPGYRIPFEHELMVQYGCSRMTVNKVLSMLAETGVIERRRRAGSFVTRPHPHIESVALDIPDIPVEVAKRGHSYQFHLLSRRRRKARRTIAHELELASDGIVLALQSLHLADGSPFALEDRVISLLAVPNIRQEDFSTTAPGSWLLEHVPWTRAQHRITAINVDELQAGLLQVDVGTACLVIERQTWRGEQCITYVKQMFLGDSYDLIAHFGPGAKSKSK